MTTSKLFSIPALTGLVAAAAVSPAAAAPSVLRGFKVTTFASAPVTAPPTTGPDDIASLGGRVFVGWQNGVGPLGEPSATGGRTGTVVEYNRAGRALHSWSLTGKIDGLGGDPVHNQLIATVNEDGNSSLYTIRPGAPAYSQVRHYSYSPAPNAGHAGGVLTGGGTDAVVVYNGQIFLSASNPMTPNATAAFHVRLNPSTNVASLTPTFADNAKATDAVTGKPVTLALTDPDSNAAVPASSPRFAGQFVLAAQGDLQLVFASRLGSNPSGLTRLRLTRGGRNAGVDDVRWTTSRIGRLIVVDSKGGTVYAVSGPFAAGQAFASQDTVGGVTQNNQVDTINLSSGALTPFLTGLGSAKGLVWLP